jgi:hypothetical protein
MDTDSLSREVSNKINTYFFLSSQNYYIFLISDPLKISSEDLQ